MTTLRNDLIRLLLASLAALAGCDGEESTTASEQDVYDSRERCTGDVSTSSTGGGDCEGGGSGEDEGSGGGGGWSSASTGDWSSSTGDWTSTGTGDWTSSSTGDWTSSGTGAGGGSTGSGDWSTTSSGAGSTGTGSSTTSGTGGACEFDGCVEAAAPDMFCNACTDDVCTADPVCCEAGWDAICVSLAESMASCGCGSDA